MTKTSWNKVFPEINYSYSGGSSEPLPVIDNPSDSTVATQTSESKSMPRSKNQMHKGFSTLFPQIVNLEAVASKNSIGTRNKSSSCAESQAPNIPVIPAIPSEQTYIKSKLTKAGFSNMFPVINYDNAVTDQAVLDSIGENNKYNKKQNTGNVPVVAKAVKNRIFNIINRSKQFKEKQATKPTNITAADATIVISPEPQSSTVDIKRTTEFTQTVPIIEHQDGFKAKQIKKTKPHFKLKFTPETHRHARKICQMAGKLGAIALSSMAAYGLTIALETPSRQGEVMQQPVPITEVTLSPAVLESTMVQEATTTNPPITTTTEAPRAPFVPPVQNKNIDASGNLVPAYMSFSIPAICLSDVPIYEMSPDKLQEVGTDTNATSLDAEVHNATSVQQQNAEATCPRIVQGKQTNPTFKTRADWKRETNPIVNGQRVGANYFQTVAGHAQSKTVLPSMIGNSTLFVHGSTHSAAGANMPLLQIGDTINTKRSDGLSTTYKLVRKEILPMPKGNSAQAVAQRNSTARAIHNPNNPGNIPLLTIYHCSYMDGRTGSDEARTVYYYAYDEALNGA